jgi:hypothetical protein
MNLGEILDRTFQIYRSRFLLFFMLAAIPGAAVMGIEAGVYFLWGPPPDGLHIAFVFNVLELGYMLGFYHFAVLFQLLMWPGFIHSVANSHAINQPVLPFRSTLRLCFIRWRGSLAISAILLSGVLVLPELVSAGIFLGIAYVASEILKFEADAMDAILTPALTFLCLAGWASIGWMNAEIAIAVPIRTIENASVRLALRQAWKRARGSRSRIFAAWLMPALLGWILTIAVSWALSLLRNSCQVDFLFRMRTHLLAENLALHGLCVPPSIVYGLRVASDGAIVALLAPLYPIALTLIYYDQRIRREGFDIEWMMSAAGLSVPAVPPPGTSETVPESIPTPANPPATAASAPATPGPLTASATGPLI